MATDSTRRLHHHTPAWVRDDAVFHIRLRIAPGLPIGLTQPEIARRLLDSTAFYHERAAWFCHLLLLMPDHLHALLCFPPKSTMQLTVGRWKAWQTRTLRISWQENFFDHRIRDRRELQLKAAYIRQNPVTKGLCPTAEDWPWVVTPAAG